MTRKVQINDYVSVFGFLFDVYSLQKADSSELKKKCLDFKIS